MSENVKLSKRLCRKVFSFLPATRLTFNLGKVLTRTILVPEEEDTEVQFRFANEVRFNANLGEFVGNDLYCFDHHFESVTLKLWRCLAKNSQTILDLGSHIGTFAVIAASVNPAAEIAAVEPCRRNLKYLRLNTTSFGNITVVDKAVGMTSGVSLFQENCSDGEGHLNGHGRIEGQTGFTESPNSKSYPVEVMTLSQLCQKMKSTRVDLMKMDLEGMEFELLTGHDNFWEAFGPRNLIVEIGIPIKDRTRLNRIINTMSNCGYDCRRCQGLYAFPWKEKEDLANWHFWKT